MSSRVTDPDGNEWVWSGSEWYREDSIWKPDVLVAGKLIDDRGDVGALIELFSKTDQYRCWIAHDQWTTIDSKKRSGIHVIDYDDATFGADIRTFVSGVENAHRP